MLRKLIILLFFFVTTARGQVPAPEITVSELDAAATRVTDTLPADDPQRESLLKSYADTRAALVAYDNFSRQFQNYTQLRATAVREAEAIQAELVRQQSAPEPQVDDLDSVSLDELDQRIQVNKNELDAHKARQLDILAAIDAMPGRPARIRQRVGELAALSAQLDSEWGLLADSVQSGGKEEARRWLTQAQLANVKAEKEALEQELLSQPMRLQLLKAQLDQSSYEITVLQKQALAMAERAGLLRQGKAAQARNTALQLVAGAKDKHLLVQRLADDNVELADSFLPRADLIGDSRREELNTRAKAEQLESDLKSIEQKLQLLGMSTAVGELLRERQAQLPESNELSRLIADNEEQITTSSLRQVELEDDRRRLRDATAYITGLAEEADPPVADSIKKDLADLASARLALVRQAIELEGTYAQALGDLDFSLRRYSGAVQAYRDFISTRLLWIPSREMFTVFNGSGLIDQAVEISEPDRWVQVLLDMPVELVTQPQIGVLILLVLILVYFTPLLKRHLAATGKDVGYVRTDNFLCTLQAVGLTLLLAVKWPLTMLMVAWLVELQEAESTFATALYIPTMRILFYFVGLELLRAALLPKGLVDQHFRWTAKLVAEISRRIVLLEWTLLPSAFLVGFFLNLYPREVGGPLGSLSVVLVLCSMAYFFKTLPAFVQHKMQRMFWDGRASENSVWGRVIRKLLYWIPLASVLAVFLGYTFTAIEISLLLIRTFVLLSCVMIFHELGLRWLSLTRRRMAYRMRQGTTARSSIDDREISAEEEILENDPELLNDEGTKLVNLLTLFGGLLGIALIWAEVMPALGILDSIELWHRMGIVDGREVPVPVSLSDVGKALLISIVGWIAVRRIPSLLEILLRQRAHVHAASAYAVTRIVQYVGTTLLVVFVVGAMGGSWSSMQWAVAALSLGIGFGLQEIVANFISGLIILFEQPIRVGDLVTVGEVSGTVTRIQIRATTIRDFDRRELLVPNKEFITNQLLNWSLTDTITRRMVQVGVAYGTDMDAALAVVDEVARKHPRVLSEPPFSVTFDQFGDNSLLISLRYFVGELDQLLKVDSEIRLEINRRFNEIGVVVSFPQRDVHLDTLAPLEIRMVDGLQSTPHGNSDPQPAS